MLMLFMVAAMAAETERELIHERTMGGLAAAAAQGRYGGAAPNEGGMMAEQRGPAIRLQDVPGAGWQFYSDRPVPDVASAAVRMLPDGCVLDGELASSIDGRLNFDALQRRLVTSPAKAATWSLPCRRRTSCSTCWRSAASICAPSAGPYAVDAWSNCRQRGRRRCSCHR
jgi:hypothetical protein